ncbi:calcium-binding protein, partial [Mameliella sediminis]|uniref:calcium-binding protein n=1 Tax=Mameliella sediminis TaxID=2836866 RepID=UPI0024849DB2
TASGGHAAGDSFVDIENIIGSDFDDVLSGDANANVFDGGAGADDFYGGFSRDTVSYANSNAAVTVALFNNTASGGHAAGDSLVSIENLTGSDFDDVLSGNGGRNVFIGGAGGDAFYGGGSSDTVSYETSNAAVTVALFNNTASGGHAAGDSFVSIENLTGSDFDDVLSGDANANTFIGGAGGDEMYGGFSRDTASYATSNAGVTVALFNNTASGGHAAGDSLVSIENLTGSDFDDVLSGNGGRNVLVGGAGDDGLYGGGAADTLDGGEGNDTLVGGSGPDQFVFGASSGQDTVLDFDDGTDLIQLTGGLTFADLTITTVAGGERIALTSDPSVFITLEGLNPGDVT